MSSQAGFEAYQDRLQRHRADLASDLGLIASSFVVMPFESKIDVNPAPEIEQSTTSEAFEALDYDIQPESIRHLSHIALASADLDSIVNRAIDSPAPYEQQIAA